ncbi:MAG: hypothetical protein FJZ57_08460, partial [Chlamydiae bacterium]|nr:hypothetical protein [Chlamydiota bacterium]
IPTNLSESSKASYNILERLAKIEYVIEQAEDAPFELQVSKSEARRKEFPSRIINLDPTTLLSSDTTLSEKIKQYLDPELVSYCKNPWGFLKEKFDINKTTKESQLNKLARLAFEDKSFVPINYKVLYHPEIKEYVVKTNSSQVSYIQTDQGTAGNNNGDHLLRFIMSKRILELESKYGLQVTSPKIHIIDSKVETENPYDRYLVVQERITTLSSRELEQSILDMPKEKQEQLAKDLCFLIVHLGFIDCHLGNITLLDNGKLCIFDEEPMGALVCSGDISPNYDLGIDECGSIGLQRLIDSSENLPIFQKIAAECLTELKEVGIDSISSRRAFHSFICCITDSLSSKEAKVIAFKKLDPRLKNFFSKIVSLMYQNSSINGSTQILEHPEILQNICSASGLNILRQLKVRFELQEGIEILTGLKNALLTPETTEKDITILVQKLAELFDGRVLFDPIYKKIKRILENIQQKHPGATAQEKLKELTLKLLNTRITGSTQCLLDDLIGMLKETKKDLSLERMTWNVTKALDSRYGSVILSPTPAQHLDKEQMLATRFPELDLSKKLNILIVAYECSMFGLKFGGLGEAIYGMAKGLSDNGHKVTLLLPKFDKLPESLQQEMELSGELKHPYKGATKKDHLYRLERNGLSVKYIE